MNFEAVARAALTRAESIVSALLPGGRIVGNEYVCGDLTGGPGGSCKVNLKTGKWKDFATDEAGLDLISLTAKVDGISQFEAAKKIDGGSVAKLNGHAVHVVRDVPAIRQMLPPPNAAFHASLFKHFKFGTPDQFWIYKDGAGAAMYAVARYKTEGVKKQIVPWIWSGEWIAKAPPKPRPLYGLDRLAKHTMAVLLVEGEKTADAAYWYWPNRPCMTWNGGTGGVGSADWRPLAGKDVTIWPDADEPGREAAAKIGQTLFDLGCTVNIIDMTDSCLQGGWDVADAKDEGKTSAELIEFAKNRKRLFESPAAVLAAVELAPEPQTREAKDNASAVPVAPAITDSDIANGKRLAGRHGKDMKFTPERGWHVWSGQQWVTDDKGVRTQELAKDTALSIFDEIRDAPARDTRMQHAKRSQSKSAVEAMIWLARSERGIPMRLTDFDKDIWSLNVVNGTIDLHTGKLRPHRRDDLISNLVDINYNPDAECELWDKFLWRILDQNEELYAYMRRFVGYLLSGDVSDQSLHFLYGKGGNGKSVFCEVVLRLLGQYAHAVSPDLIMQKRNAGIPNDVARLRGVRVAFMNETSQGSRFDEAKLKDLTGGDTLSARFLHQEFFDFEPTHRLVIRGNYKPAINGTDEGIWRRLRLVPFTVTIPDDEKDGQLKAKLFAELPGILNWAIRGCLEWQANGLNPPAIITEAVQAYREQSDTLGRFIEERYEVRKLGQVKTSVFFKGYQEFAETAGERWLQLKDLPGEMQRRGFLWKRTKAGGIFEGLELQNHSFDQGFG